MDRDWVGQTLNDRYEIVETLGVGGMATVFRANDPNLNRVVAIKLIHQHLSTNPDFVRRFRVEATAVAQLRHPNIVQVFDFDTTGDTAYIVFEFVPGENLQDRLARMAEAKRSMSTEEIVKISTQLADALDYAHARDLIHRDVKPANVILDVNGDAFLADFGIVKITDGIQHTVTGAVVGTARYMAPEQIRGTKVDGRTDLYSLGVTMFEMASGQPPFEADSAITLMMMHVNDPVPDTSGAGIEAPVGVIVERALAKDPGDRYATAGDMAAALREAAAAATGAVSAVRAPDPGVAPPATASREPEAVEVPPEPAPPEEPATASREPEAVEVPPEPAPPEEPATASREPEAVEVPPEPAPPEEPATASREPEAVEVPPAPVPPEEVATVVAAPKEPAQVVPATTPAAPAAPPTGAAALPGKGSGDSRRRLAVIAGMLAAVVIIIGLIVALSGGGEEPALAGESTVLAGAQEDETTTTLAPQATAAPTTTRAITSPDTTTMPLATAEAPYCDPTGAGLGPVAGEPVAVILDTGIGTGIDDIGALAILHVLADLGEVRILAVMTSNGGDAAAGPTIDVINTYYGRPDIPVGVVTGLSPELPSPYSAELAASFDHDDQAPVPAIDLYRQILESQPDGSVTIVSVGFLTNLVGLLESRPKQEGGTSGEELISFKVRRLISMGGYYPDSVDHPRGAEFNFSRDAIATSTLASRWPTPVVFSGWEVGRDILTGGTILEDATTDSPVREAYRLFNEGAASPSYDMTAALVAVRGTAGLFDVCIGQNIIDTDGSNRWQDDTEGRQGYLRPLVSNGEISDVLDALLTTPPQSSN